MVARVTVKTTGGDRLKRHLAKQKRAAREANGSIAIGFRGHVAGLAALHEYGNRSANIPERPVARPAGRDGGAMSRAVVDAVGKGIPTAGVLREAAREGKAGLRSAYLSASGTVRPVGPTQQARKRGTPGANRPLVGTKGPRLIDHISAWIDGQEVK